MWDNDNENYWESWEERIEEYEDLLAEIDNDRLDFWRSEEEGWFYQD